MFLPLFLYHFILALPLIFILFFLSPLFPLSFFLPVCLSSYSFIHLLTVMMMMTIILTKLITDSHNLKQYWQQYEWTIILLAMIMAITRKEKSYKIILVIISKCFLYSIYFHFCSIYIVFVFFIYFMAEYNFYSFHIFNFFLN